MSTLCVCMSKNVVYGIDGFKNVFFSKTLGLVGCPALQRWRRLEGIAKQPNSGCIDKHKLLLFRVMHGPMFRSAQHTCNQLTN